MFRDITPYLDSDALNKIKSYEWIGDNQSMSHKYFFGPLAQTVVNRLPRSLSANVLTLSKFVICAIQFVSLFGIYGTKFENEGSEMS